MKRLCILIFYIMIPFGMFAQQQMEYNKKGDEAMKRSDYRDAKMWYEEGVAQCDAYSINQLTNIWLSKEDMRASMRSLMNKCLNCLTVKATENDLDAISKLIIYYSKGIGTPKNEELVSYWKDYQKKLLKTADNSSQPTNSHHKMHFFIGYNYSMESPYGVTLGGLAKRFGWYLRVKTNASFSSFEYECNAKGEIIDASDIKGESYEYNNAISSKKKNYMGTVGLVVKCSSWLYLSVGAGYGERTLLHPFNLHSYVDYDQVRGVWCKDIDSSYKGVAAEADAMVKIGEHFFLSAGCNTIQFKYVDLNAGIGIIF